MLYTYDYDRSYDPAMPVAQVEIWYGTTTPPLTLNAIIDSGADATILPVAQYCLWFFCNKSALVYMIMSGGMEWQHIGPKLTFIQFH